MTYVLEREGNVLKRVCVAFSGVGIEHAPSFKSANDEREVPHVEISGGIYSVLARKNIMNWQAVLSGPQIVDLDYDNYELRFHAENIGEEHRIHVKSFKPGSSKSLEYACDIEQLGREFRFGRISVYQIEWTSHFRARRITFEVGRS